jgi:hypothetical protein
MGRPVKASPQRAFSMIGARLSTVPVEKPALRQQ